MKGVKFQYFLLSVVEAYSIWHSMNMKESDPELARVDNVCHAIRDQYSSPEGYRKLRL